MKRDAYQAPGHQVARSYGEIHGGTGREALGGLCLAEKSKAPACPESSWGLKKLYEHEDKEPGTPQARFWVLI